MIKHLLGTILLVTAAAASAQALPRPTPINVPLPCWSIEDGRKVLTEALKGPYKPLIEAREGEGTDNSRLLILADSSDGELFMFRIIPDAAVCLLSHGFIEKLNDKVYKGI